MKNIFLISFSSFGKVMILFAGLLCSLILALLPKKLNKSTPDDLPSIEENKQKTSKKLETNITFGIGIFTVIWWTIYGFHLYHKGSHITAISLWLLTVFIYAYSIRYNLLKRRACTTTEN